MNFFQTIEELRILDEEVTIRNLPESRNLLDEEEDVRTFSEDRVLEEEDVKTSEDQVLEVEDVRTLSEDLDVEEEDEIRTLPESQNLIDEEDVRTLSEDKALEEEEIRTFSEYQDVDEDEEIRTLPESLSLLYDEDARTLSESQLQEEEEIRIFPKCTMLEEEDNRNLVFLTQTLSQPHMNHIPVIHSPGLEPDKEPEGVEVETAIPMDGLGSYENSNVKRLTEDVNKASVKNVRVDMFNDNLCVKRNAIVNKENDGEHESEEVGLRKEGQGILDKSGSKEPTKSTDGTEKDLEDAADPECTFQDLEGLIPELRKETTKGESARGSLTTEESQRSQDSDIHRRVRNPTFFRKTGAVPSVKDKSSKIAIYIEGLPSDIDSGSDLKQVIPIKKYCKARIVDRNALQQPLRDKKRDRELVERRSPNTACCKSINSANGFPRLIR